jgi:V8-like Glu-specific endopeptidase
MPNDSDRRPPSDHLARALEDYVEQLRHHATEMAEERTAAADDVTVRVAAAEIAAAAQRAKAKLASRDEHSLTELEYASLEAIVQITGRPAMRYAGGAVETPNVGDDRSNEHWTVFVTRARRKINAASASVGRVWTTSGGGRLLATAWRIGDDLVVTNRHVVEDLVSDATAPPSAWQLDPNKPAVVDFGATDGVTAPRPFAIADLAYCAPRGDIDLAVMRLTTAGQPLPPPLALEWDSEALGTPATGAVADFDGEEIYTVGHPYRAFASAQSSAVFGNADGMKRCAPGYVTAIPEDGQTFEHDCSTLGGNSGSCIFSVWSHRVVGLHYAGATVVETTGMGRANLAIGICRLGDHPAAAILREGRIR